MKKTLLLISLVLCFGVVSAQTTNGMLKKNTKTEKTGLYKTVSNPSHLTTLMQKAKKVTNRKDVIPSGYARVTLTAVDVWGDGSGYQLLLDADHTAYGDVIPETGALSDTSAASIASMVDVYAMFEYKIPTNADASLTTTNVITGGNSVSIDIPVGIYDYVVVNPTPNARFWIAPSGRADDYSFQDGIEYIFSITGDAQNGDALALTTNDTRHTFTATNVWDFQDQVMPADFTLYNDSNTPNSQISAMFPDAWDVISLDSTNYYAAAPSYFTAVNAADRWMITAPIVITANNSTLKVDVKSQDANYLESMNILLSTTTTDKTAFTTTLEAIGSVPGSWTTKTYDLTSYIGQTVYVAFQLTSTDMFFGEVDNIKFGKIENVVGLNDANAQVFSIYPNPTTNNFTVNNAQGSMMRVMNTLGQVVMSENITNNSQVISTNNLKQGMYFVEINNNGKVSTQKLIVK